MPPAGRWVAVFITPDHAWLTRRGSAGDRRRRRRDRDGIYRAGSMTGAA